MTSPGPFHLGRIPSPPDARDYKLADFLSAAPADPLVAAMAVLQASHAAAATKEWAAIATQRILAVSPAPLAPAPPAPVSVTWADSEPVLDQGQFGTCVGNGWAQFGNTLPIDDRFIEKDARAIYYEATVIDGTPDNPDVAGGGQQGSTVRSGAKAMVNRGRIKAYAFAAGVTEIRAWLQTKGPVVFGTNWTADMFNPDASGFVRPTGAVQGGHCFVCRGDLADQDAALFRNSWGASWGLAGDFKMKWADVAGLFAQQGEACVAVEV